MLDKDLAALYGVDTRALIQAVKRNAERFPEDFCFQLSNQEFTGLRSQIVISTARWTPSPTLRIHRAGRCDAIGRFE